MENDTGVPINNLKEKLISKYHLLRNFKQITSIETKKKWILFQKIKSFKDQK